jgi:hypothetical protein
MERAKLPFLELSPVPCSLALELLKGCGMILRARLRTSPAGARCPRSLSFRVHYSLVILCNDLNLSGESHV